MNINIDLEKMKLVHGEEIVEIIYENIDLVEKNIKILKDYKFDDIEGIFERCPMIFMHFTKEFNNKIEKLKNDLGEEYVDIIQNDVGIIEEIFN